MSVIWNIVVIGIKIISSNVFNVMLVINYMKMEFVEFVNNNVVQHQIISSIQYVIGAIYQIAFYVNIFKELIKINYSNNV